MLYCLLLDISFASPISLGNLLFFRYFYFSFLLMHFCSRPVSPSIVHFLVVVVVFGGCCHFCLIDVDGFVGCSPFSTLFIYLCAFYLFTHLHTAKYKRFAVAASVVTVVNTAAIAAATAAAYGTRAYRCVFLSLWHKCQWDRYQMKHCCFIADSAFDDAHRLDLRKYFACHFISFSRNGFAEMLSLYWCFFLFLSLFFLSFHLRWSNMQ